MSVIYLAVDFFPLKGFISLPFLPYCGRHLSFDRTVTSDLLSHLTLFQLFSGLNNECKALEEDLS